MSWALFDLDDTLLDHDSFARFTGHLLRRNPLRAAGTLLLSPLVALLLHRRTWRIHAGSVLLWIGTVGMSDAELDRIVQRYLHRLNVNDRIRPGGADAMAQHFHANDNVAVVTACADVLALPLCRAIDPRIQVVASTLRRRAGGLVADRHCHGGRKVEMLTESGVEGEIVAGYGDSAADGPMLDLARTAVLVNLPERTAKVLRGHLTGPDRVVFADWPP
ncbi:HAD family hydrolase [Nocardiopsis oceani]